MSITLHNGDCLAKMAAIESGSVDAIITDPPYGTVKGVGDGNVSHGMKGKTQWDDALDHAFMLEECNRILRPNGALVLFGQDPYTARLMTDTHGNLPFSYRYAWLKDHFANALIAKKAPVNYTEDVCVFFKKYDTLAQHPLREYGLRLRAFTNYSRSRFFAEFGSGALQHFMESNSNSMQFALCTEAAYDAMALRYKADTQPWFKLYSELVSIDAAHKATIARTFNLPQGAKYKSNVLEYRKDYRGEHPTQKPVALMEDLVHTYTNPADTVLDFTMGSGTTGVACVNLGRDFIGIERDEGYFATAQGRISGGEKKSENTSPFVLTAE